MNKDSIIEALKKVRYPGNGKDLVEAGIANASDIDVNGNEVKIALTFERPTDPFYKSMIKAVEAAVLTFVSNDLVVKGNVTAKFLHENPVKAETPLKEVKNIIGVSSGKGGVGKSTVATNLAVALAMEGYKVGLLDADIFGPSVPKMLGAEKDELYMHRVGDRDLIIPDVKYGIKMLSIGFLVDPSNPVIWRGAMASNALKQLITDADWGELDYFVIDMPPGTSDIHLTIVQTLPVTGAVIVTTPQDVALADARKGIAMFREEKINVPVLGVVENMAWFTPSKHPDEKYYIFGKEGASKLAREFGVPVLAQIPITESICDGGDHGKPVALDENSITGQSFLHLAHEVIDAVEKRNSELPPSQPVGINRK
ncbi:MAG: Mrp/NBP35 family ATP-binding protein [Muribaculaceae bacterium]|nr:Mrp/NBP35 family ATP-binding protein [Muribaculaceae bacterium]